ncbi:MAG: GNAT family N-acetyltransferase [Spirochaetales bacterium]|nr:GNAT family N-acetyltransferase [Spirochaetales bacterium]
MRKKGTKIPHYPLPEGFRFEFYQPGDERCWAEIKTSVLEFSHLQEALKCFEKDYLDHIDELRRRCLFLVTDQGEKVGTAMAWWSTRDELRVPSIHWVSIKPEYQNLGLGKALVCQAVNLSIELDGDRDSFIHTQTWSYPAIGIYIKSGYKILREGHFACFPNDYSKALPYLRDKMGTRFHIDNDTTVIELSKK